MIDPSHFDASGSLLREDLLSLSYAYGDGKRPRQFQKSAASFLEDYPTDDPLNDWSKDE